MDDKTMEQLRQMLNVGIDRIEQQGDDLIVYVPKDQVAKAIGAGGCVVRSVELVLGRKLVIKESI